MTTCELCANLSWRAAGDSEMMSEASFRAREAFCSPSAAITCKAQFLTIENNKKDADNHLCPRLPCGFSLCCHRSLQVLWQPHILHLVRVNSNTEWSINTLPTLTQYRSSLNKSPLLAQYQYPRGQLQHQSSSEKNNSLNSASTPYSYLQSSGNSLSF